MAGQIYAEQNKNTQQTGQSAQNTQPLSEAQDYYITFVAVHGLDVREDGTYERISSEQFAGRIGVHRNTLYYWQKTIPNFWDLVNQREKEVWHHNTKRAIIRGLKLQALKGGAKQAEMLWSHFGDYVPPTQRHDVKVSGLGDLFDIARKKKNQDAA